LERAVLLSIASRILKQEEEVESLETILTVHPPHAPNSIIRKIETIWQRMDGKLLFFEGLSRSPKRSVKMNVIKQIMDGLEQMERGKPIQRMTSRIRPQFTDFRAFLMESRLNRLREHVKQYGSIRLRSQSTKTDPRKRILA
jgi:hypothetical protein